MTSVRLRPIHIYSQPIISLGVMFSTDLCQSPGPDLTPAGPDLTLANPDLNLADPSLTPADPDLTSSDPDLTSAGPGRYVRTFGCKMEEAAEPDLLAYDSLSALFRRELKPDARPIDPHCPLVRKDNTTPAFGSN